MLKTPRSQKLPPEPTSLSTRTAISCYGPSTFQCTCEVEKALKCWICFHHREVWPEWHDATCLAVGDSAARKDALVRRHRSVHVVWKNSLDAMFVRERGDVDLPKRRESVRCQRRCAVLQEREGKDESKQGSGREKREGRSGGKGEEGRKILRLVNTKIMS